MVLGFCGIYFAIQLTIYAVTFWLPAIIKEMLATPAPHGGHRLAALPRSPQPPERRASGRVQPEETGTATTAALLHNLGRLVFALGPPERQAEVDRLVALGLRELPAQEQVYSCTYATAGAFLLNYWGLPLDIVQAVAMHADPSPGHSRHGPYLSPYNHLPRPPPLAYLSPSAS